MGGDDALAIDNAHGIEGGEDRQGTADIGMGDRIIIEIKTYIRRFADMDLLMFVTEKGRIRHGHQRAFIPLVELAKNRH